MMLTPRFLTALISFLLLFSCATNRGRETGYQVYVTDSQKYELLQPDAFEEPMDRFQTITGTFQGKVHIFGAYIRSSGEEVAVSFFNQMGGGVGELVYTGDTLNANSHFFPQGTKFEYMMADFQFCYCKKELLSSRLGESGLRLECQLQDKREIRQIWSGNQLVIQIEREKDRTRLTNFLRQYSYDIQEGN